MEAIINYAREQDSKIMAKSRLGFRSYAFLHGLILGPMIVYVMYVRIQ